MGQMGYDDIILITGSLHFVGFMKKEVIKTYEVFMLINNAMIYVNHKPVKDAKGVVIVTHGIALHTTYYEEVRQALSHAGYHVFLYDVRGHGKSHDQEET